MSNWYQDQRNTPCLTACFFVLVNTTKAAMRNWYQDQRNTLCVTACLRIGNHIKSRNENLIWRQGDRKCCVQPAGRQCRQTAPQLTYCWPRLTVKRAQSCKSDILSSAAKSFNRHYVGRTTCLFQTLQKQHEDEAARSSGKKCNCGMTSAVGSKQPATDNIKNVEQGTDWLMHWFISVSEMSDVCSVYLWYSLSCLI